MLKEHLIKLGFKEKLPWQFIDDFYLLVNLDSDSYGFDMWSITSLRYDEVNFRGRVRSVEEFNLIFALVKEDYNLTEGELELLKR
jgi:hypothetical protein